MAYSASVLHTRHQRLASLLQEHRLDALAINPGPSMGYLTGASFHLSERPVVVLFRPE
ncbi:MAG: aminopeptidase P family N-terminal domain-containing protein, partial [Bacteroidota bacterium]